MMQSASAADTSGRARTESRTELDGSSAATPLSSVPKERVTLTPIASRVSEKAAVSTPRSSLSVRSAPTAPWPQRDREAS